MRDGGCQFRSSARSRSFGCRSSHSDRERCVSKEILSCGHRIVLQEDAPSPRLVLLSHSAPVIQGSNVMEVDRVAQVLRNPPDSHEHRFRRVRQAMQRERGALERQVEVAAEPIRRLATRVGPFDGMRSRGRFAATSGRLSTSHSSGLLPKKTDKSPVLVWLTDVAQSFPNANAAGVQVAGPEALTVGWEALRDVMRRMGIPSREQFAERIHNQGFPMPRWRAHFRGRVQERILNIEIAQDAMVSALAAVCVVVTLAECEHRHAPVVPPTPRATAPDIHQQ